MSKSKDFKFAIIFALLIAAVLLWALWPKQVTNTQTVAVVSVAGKEVLRTPLDGKTETFTIQGKPFSFKNSDGTQEQSIIVATLTKDQNGICFTNSICPDHLCEKTGYLTHAGDTAICMPGQIVLLVEES